MFLRPSRSLTTLTRTLARRSFASTRAESGASASWSSRAKLCVGATTAAVAGVVYSTSTPSSCGAASPSAGGATKGFVSVYDFPLGHDFPHQMPCFIEVAKGSRNKYEWDESVGFLRLDRVLHSAVFYPHNYGFVPQTLCGDGDPLDVLVLGEEYIPGAIVDVRPLGYMIMEDEKGLDEKVLAVPVHDPRFEEYKTLRDVPEHLLREIAHFFSTYKALEKKKWAKVGGWKGTEDTLILLEETHDAYKAAKSAALPVNAKAQAEAEARAQEALAEAAKANVPQDAAY